MEHRIDRRIPADLEAEVYVGTRHIGVFPVGNIGASGLCLENCEGMFRSDNYLRVVVASARRATTLQWTTNALVVWTSNSRAGLMWAEENRGFLDLFRQLLKNAA